MKPLSIAAITFLLTSVAGCSLVSHEDEHPSQGVYQVELASAKHFMQQANKLENEMLTFCEEGDLQQVQQQDFLHIKIEIDDNLTLLMYF